MNIDDYIKKETEEDNLNRISEIKYQMRVDKTKKDFEKNFKELIINGVIKDLFEISKSNSDFNVRENSKDIESHPYEISVVIEVEINFQVAQYYLYLKADPKITYDGIMFRIESSGYQRSLEEKLISFNELKDFDVENYLTSSFEEFKKFD